MDASSFPLLGCESGQQLTSQQMMGLTQCEVRIARLRLSPACVVVQELPHEGGAPLTRRRHAISSHRIAEHSCNSRFTTPAGAMLHYQNCRDWPNPRALWGDGGGRELQERANEPHGPE